jgi:hypothetical protein
MATFAAILIIALVGGLVVWLLVRRPRPDSSQLHAPSETPTMRAPTTVDLGIRVEVRSGPRPGEPDPWGDEDRHPDYPLHAVGESHYQDALREIVEAAEEPGPNWSYRGAQCTVTAQLIPESDDPHDSQAVRVEIQGRKVGHLSRADARQYRSIFEAQRVPIAALIVGGWDQRYRDEIGPRATGSFGVRLQFSMETRDPLPAAKPVEPAPSSPTTSKVTEVRTGLVAQVPVTEFPVDVMGEVRYQHVLEKICGGRTPRLP